MPIFLPIFPCFTAEKFTYLYCTMLDYAQWLCLSLYALLLVQHCIGRKNEAGAQVRLFKCMQENKVEQTVDDWY